MWGNEQNRETHRQTIQREKEREEEGDGHTGWVTEWPMQEENDGITYIIDHLSNGSDHTSAPAGCILHCSKKSAIIQKTNLSAC